MFSIWNDLELSLEMKYPPLFNDFEKCLKVDKYIYSTHIRTNNSFVWSLPNINK